MCHLKEDGRENTHSNNSICDSCTSFDNYNHYLVGVCTQEKVVLHVSLALLLHPFLLLEEEADKPCEQKSHEELEKVENMYTSIMEVIKMRLSVNEK